MSSVSGYRNSILVTYNTSVRYFELKKNVQECRHLLKPQGIAQDLGITLSQILVDIATSALLCSSLHCGEP